MNRKDIQTWIVGSGNSGIGSAKRLFLQLLLPGRCPICGRLNDPGQYAHASCRARLIPATDNICFRCGKILADPRQEYCSECEKGRRVFQCGRSLWLQDRIVSRSLYEFKYGNRREYADFYGEEMYSRYAPLIRKWKIDCIIPVPVHKERYRIRGYNQSELLARKLSAATGIPVNAKNLVRKKATAAQKNLTRRERKENLEQAFYCTSSIGGRVLLMDDIFTTGSTIDACAKVLLKNGTEAVFFLTVSTGAENR